MKNIFGAAIFVFWRFLNKHRLVLYSVLMQIGIDARFYSSAFTGIGRYVYELIDHLLRLDQKNRYTIFLNQPGYDLFRPTQPNVKKNLVNVRHYSLREQWHFWRILQNANLDLMHFTHFNAPLLYRKPSIVTIHDLTLSLYPGKKMNGLWQRLAYHFTIRSIVRRAASVIAVSKHTKNDLVKILHVDPAKISVIHEGVNPMFHKIADWHIVKDFLEHENLTRPYLLYTGVWRSHKNLVNLIQAFALLKKKYHFTGQLVITGKEDPWYPEVKEAVKKENLAGEVRFTGLVPDEDLVLLYNGSLAYVLPSLYEGFGLPALEAFACGIPVCCARTSSLPEVCADAAEYFDPKNPADMAEHIASVINNPEKTKNMIAKGTERLKEFSWRTMAKQTLALYNEVPYVHSAS